MIFQKMPYLLRIKLFFLNQQQDKKDLKESTTSNDYVIKLRHGAGKIRKVITKQDKIVIPSTLHKRLVEWYHNQLCHPGKTCMELTIRKNFIFKGIRKTIHDICSTCHSCQLTKKHYKKYGKLPAKKAESSPW